MAKSKPWKDHERKAAAAIGGKRLGATGTNSPDAENEWLSIECKAWKLGCRKAEAVLEQAERNATSGKLPIGLIHTHGRTHAKDLVVLRWSDFLDYFGKEG